MEVGTGIGAIKPGTGPIKMRTRIPLPVSPPVPLPLTLPARLAPLPAKQRFAPKAPGALHAHMRVCRARITPVAAPAILPVAHPARARTVQDLALPPHLGTIGQRPQ